ncbi:MAG: HAMP domain-containing histidine kinase [Actinobacteria bacterium]|nr:HAMP domain-containing histidine kinase [Actinomycetota bacterium]
MRLRTRLTVVVAAAVGIAVVSVACIAWFATRARLVDEVDTSLRSRTQRYVDASARSARRGAPPPVPGPAAAGLFGDPDTYFQRLDDSGRPRGRTGLVLPVDAREVEVAAAPGTAQVRDVTVDGIQLRMYTAAVPEGGAIQVARDLGELDAAMRGLAVVLIVTSLLGVAGAALVGRLIARRSLRPIDDLTGAAEEVARSQNLAVPIPVARADDEVGRLAASFNAMLGALAASREQQQHLVSDASHELRTPLTSLRTAIELLQRGTSLPEAERRELLDHAVSELDELTHLVTELVELATDARSEPGAIQDVRLDLLVREVAGRVERRSGRAVTVDAQPCVVVGRAALLERAVGNLLDNAAKWSPPGAPVDVTVAGGTVAVSDHGPGVPPDERARVFERFARGRGSQDVPGSGLGLAIVAKVAAEHGGRAWIEESASGGARAVLALPAVRIEAGAGAFFDDSSDLVGVALKGPDEASG